MVTATCPMPNPPPDCPLLNWTPIEFLCWLNRKSRMLEKVEAVECEMCGMLWTPEGGTIDREKLQ